MTRSDIKNIHTDPLSFKASLFDSVTRFPAYPAVFDRLKQMTRNWLLGQIIAEGIQTDRKLGVLRNLCVPLGQGFLFGLPAQEFSTPAPIRV